MPIQTNWVIISGPPCSGKTAIINEFHKLGYKVCNEVARDWIDERRAKGLDTSVDYLTSRSCQDEIIYREMSMQQAQNPSDFVVFDFDIIGTFSYYKLHHLSIEPALNEEIQRHLTEYRYQQVFLLGATLT